MKDEIGHSLSAIKCPPGCFFFYYSPLNQQFSCLFISESQWPFVMLFTSPVLGGSWPHFLPSRRGTLVLLWFFSLPCVGMFPSCHVICLHWRGELADSETSGWTSSETNLQPSLPRKARTTGSHASLPKTSWTVVLEAGQSEAKHRMWSCLSVTSLHHFSLALPPPQSRPHQFVPCLLAPHKHPAIHTVMNRLLPWIP